MIASNVLVFFTVVGISLESALSAPQLERAQDVDIGQDLSRPGVCQPDLGAKKFLSNEICGVTCAFDVDCPNHQKCCPNSCGGTMCAHPFVEDPCLTVECPRQGQVCQVNHFGVGVCTCNDKCPEIYQPVCAHNDRMFENRCKMDYRACKKGKILTEVPCPGRTEAIPVTQLGDFTPTEHEQNINVELEEEIGIVVEDVATTTSGVTTSPAEKATTQATTAAFVEPVKEETSEPISGLHLTVPAFQKVEVGEGQDAKLYCDAISPDEAPTYLWLYHRGSQPKVISKGHQKDGLMVSNDGHYLTISNVMQSITGIYTCMVKTGSDLLTARYQVTITESAAETTERVPTQNVTTPPTRTTPVAKGKGSPGKPHVPLEPKDGTNAAICSLPMDEGNCLRRDAFPKWYYDIATQQCRSFTYNGCGGNANRFNSYSECFSACPVLPNDPCKHPIYTGPCRAHFVRWAYDEVSRQCEQFVYGGCGKNGNNFETRETCTSNCQDIAARKDDCNCIEPNFIDSFCSSPFVITCYVRQKMIVPGFGALLSMEVETIVVAGNLTTQDVPYLSGPLVVIRDVAQDACQCHDARADGKLYIVMGYLNEDGYAIVDDTSYVKTGTEKRLAKLIDLQERADRRCAV